MKEDRRTLTRSEAVELLRLAAARLPMDVSNIETHANLEAMANEIASGDIGYVDDDTDPVIAKIVQHLYNISDSPIRRQLIDWDLIQTIGDGSTMDVLAEPISLYLEGCNLGNVEAPIIHRRDVARVLVLFTKTIRAYTNKNPHNSLNDWGNVITLIDESQVTDKDEVLIKETGTNEKLLTKKEIRDILISAVKILGGN